MSLIQTILPRFGNNREIMNAAITGLLSSLPSLLTPITEAFESGNHGELKRALHRLKGSIGYFASDEVYQLVALCEDSVGDVPSANLSQSLEQLDRAVDSLKTELEAISSGAGAPA